MLNTGKQTIFAGSGKRGYKDGAREKAEFNFSTDWDAIAVDQHTGFIYVSDSYNHLIRVIDLQGRREVGWEQRGVIFFIND
jgi:hypothetical protein